MSSRKYTLNGKEVTREEFLKGANDDFLKSPAMATDTYSEHDPLISQSSGVLPRQVKAEREKLRKYQEKGQLTGVRILDNGSVALTSRGEQGRIGWNRYRKKVDLDAGYGDTYTDDGRFGD